MPEHLPGQPEIPLHCASDVHGTAGCLNVVPGGGRPKGGSSDRL